MADDSSSVPFCSSCGKLKEALEAAKKEHSLTLKMVKEKIISTDELIKKYQQKCLESERHRQQVTDYTLKLEAAQMKIESLQGQLDRSLHSTEPLRKNAARLHREKSLADSTTSELRQRLQKLETLNSEMMNTAKLKEQQECAWRLEKQVQAHEFETQRKSLEKSTATVSKLQDQLKKEKDKNKELNKSLTQTKKNIAKLEQQLRESKDEIESVKLDVELAQALGTKQTSKPRLKRKNSQHVQPYKEAEQSSSPVSTQRVAHIIQELRELSDIGTPLSPLPPSPERGSPDISSSSDESDSENGCVDEGNAGDFGDSESSLGDIADLFIGDNNELGEVQESPVRTAVDKPIGDEEIDCKTSKDSVENNSNADNGKTGREESSGEQASITAVGSPLEGKKNCNKNVHYSVANNRNAEESLADQTTDQLKASENYSTSNCEVKCNREINISQDLKAAEQGTCSSVAKLDSNLHSTTRRSSEIASVGERVEEAFKTVKPISASKFAGGSPTRQRKGKRGSMSPITSPSVMTRSRAKAMKLSPSSEADSESEKETGNELNSSRERISKKSGNELEHDEITRKVKKLTGDNANNERTVTYEHTDDDSHQCRNTGHFGQSADATSSPNMKVAGEDNSKTFLKEADLVFNSSSKKDGSNKSGNLDIENKQDLSFSSTESENKSGVSVNSLTDQKDNAGERLLSDHNSNNTDSVGSYAKNDIENIVTNKCTQGKKIFLQDKNGPGVSENSLQAEETVSEAKEGTLEENNNEILEVFENTPDELEVSSVEINSSHETEMSVQGSCSVFNTATGEKTSCLPEPATGDVNNENNQPRRAHFLEEDEMKAGANSRDAFARDVFNSLVKGTEDAKPEGSNLTRGGDVSLDPTTMTRAINSSVWESREEGSLDSKSELERELSSHSFSIVEDETPGVSSSTMDIDLDQVITETTTATSYEDTVAETNDDVSSTAKTGDSHVTIATISSASSASMEVKCEDRDSKKSFSTLAEKAISHTSDDVRQVTEVEYELSKTENSIPQAEIFEVARKHSTNQEEKTHNDCKGDRPSCGGQEVELSSSSSLEGEPCEIESVVSTFQVVIDEPGSSNAENSFEANDHSQPSLSGNTVNKLENPSVKLAQKDTLSIQAVMKDLEDLIGDQFQSLSPLPPSPCPSDDESSPIRDLRIGDFPPLSPLPPSPCSLVDEECPSSPISTSDSNKRTEVAPSGPMAVSRISQHPKQRHPTANYTELSSKTLKRGSLGEGTSFDKRSDDRESLVKIQSAESGRRTVKRTLQQSVSESGNDLDLVPQRKKIKTCKKVNQTQERITLFEGVHTVFETCSTSTLVPGKSKGTVCRGEPVTRKRPSTENINTSDAPLTANQPKQSTSKTCASEAQATTKRNVSNSIEVTEVKDSKHRPLSKRFKGQSEVKYVLRCLTRLYEDSVEVNLVVRRFSTKTCISSCTPLASAIVQFLKTREDEVMFLILAQLEKYQSTERQQEWQPVLSGFEGRLLEVVTQLSDGFAGFGNFISQLASLCSRSLITACGNSKPGDFKGALSLCRVFTALCQLKGDLNCARVVCYDVLRLMYGSQKAALELVVAMVTVWPEILRASRDCWSDDKLPLARTLQVVLLSWADSFSSELGNILRRLCCWGGDPVTQETLKDLGARLVKKLHEESLISVCISQDGNMVANQVSFELVKSLELLCCVLGWQWTMNDLIIDNIWRILDTWTGLADSDEVGCLTEMAPLVTASTGKQNGIVQKDEDSFARAKSNCRCQTSNDENVCTELPSLEVINGKETKEKNQMDVGEGCEVCQKCGQLKKQRLAESQIVVCIQLLGVLCKIAIENHQAAVLEIEDLLCGLVEETSPSKVTYAIQLAATGSLLDMSPWQPQRVTTVISKWLAGVKESCSLKAPACITQGLLCLKSIMMSYPAKQGAATLR